MTELPAPNGIGHGLFAAGLAQANRAAAPIANREGPNSLDQWLEEVFSTGTEEGITWKEAAAALFACGAVRDEAETKALCETATQVGLELGRREAGEEIAAAIEEYSGHEPLRWRVVAARIARDVATRTADARTDPSGHTDLPPTPDAGSKRLPEDAP